MKDRKHQQAQLMAAMITYYQGDPKRVHHFLKVHDFAAAIVSEGGVDASVAPVTSIQYKEMHPESADRPAWSALDNRMLRCTVGNPVRPWQEALHEFFLRWDGENGIKDEMIG